MQANENPAPAKRRAFERLDGGARPAVEAALAASLAIYDRETALSRFHRLSKEIIQGDTVEAARQVVREIERALRAERARGGHFTYDLNRHIALLVAHRAERARLARLLCGESDAFPLQSGELRINSADRSAADKGV